jgi:hypothetical protein
MVVTVVSVVPTRLEGDGGLAIVAKIMKGAMSTTLPNMDTTKAPFVRPLRLWLY